MSRSVPIACVAALGWMTAAQTAGAPTPADRLPVMGFYMGWDDAARRSLATHVGALDQVVPGLATLTGADHRVRCARDDALHRILDAAPRRPALIPMVQNVAMGGGWDGQGAAALLASPAARRRFVADLATMVAAERGQGVMLDLESLPAAAHPGYRALLHALHRRFAARGWQVMIAAPVADPDWDLAAYARVTDRIVLMAYDEHWMGGPPGPIASQRWFARTVVAAVAATGPKAIVALGNYAYDWSDGRTEPMTVGAARGLARQMGVTPTLDPASGNWHFAYRADGRNHQVWLLDATTAASQLRVVRRTRAAGIALWRLGSEDPQFWPATMGHGYPPFAVRAVTTAKY